MLKGFDEPNVRAYYELLVESALLLGAKDFNLNPFNEIKDLINFQILMVNVSTHFYGLINLDVV